MSKGLFSDRQFNRGLIRLALPIAFQSLMLASVAAADALMLGNVTQNFMAAVSLATQIQFVQNTIISAIIAACTALGAQYWGKRDLESLSDVFGITVRVSMTVSFIFFIGCVFFPQYLMMLFTSDTELISIGCDYLKIAGWSYLLTGLSQCYLVMFKLTDHASEAATISTAGVLINIALNAVLIFGVAFIPAMEVRGAATATLIARAAETGWCLVSASKKGHIRLKLSSVFTNNRLLSKDFTKCLLPLLGAGLLWGVGFTAYTAFIGHMGADAAAANSVASVVRDLICCLCNGVAYGGGILVGNELGAGKLDIGKMYGIRVMKLGYVFGIASTIIMLALTPLVVHMVRLTEGAASHLTAMMVIMAFYMIGRTVNTVTINGIFTAGGDTAFDFYSLIVSMWCVAVPLAALGTFVFHWPVWVVYACTCLDEVGKIPWVMYHFGKYKWVRDLTRER